MNEFPPRTNYKRDVEVILKFLASVINEEKTIYMSAPITSGKRLIQFYENGSHLNQKNKRTYAEILTSIIEFNRLHAQVAARKIRKKIHVLVIDPTSVQDIAGWTQSDYRFLWAKVIEIYADKVVNIDGWNYSNGCAYEFLTAKQLNKKVLDEDLKPISTRKGIRLIQDAIEELTKYKLSVKFLQSVVEELNKIK